MQRTCLQQNDLCTFLSIPISSDHLAIHVHVLLPQDNVACYLDFQVVHVCLVWMGCVWSRWRGYRSFRTCGWGLSCRHIPRTSLMPSCIDLHCNYGETPEAIVGGHIHEETPDYLKNLQIQIGAKTPRTEFFFVIPPSTEKRLIGMIWEAQWEDWLCRQASLKKLNQEFMLYNYYSSFFVTTDCSCLLLLLHACLSIFLPLYLCTHIPVMSMYYCTSGRALQENIWFKADSIGPTVGSANAEANKIIFSCTACLRSMCNNNIYYMTHCCTELAQPFRV